MIVERERAATKAKYLYIIGTPVYNYVRYIIMYTFTIRWEGSWCAARCWRI